MSTVNKNRLINTILCTLTGGLIVGLLGSAIGTYCWFEFTARAKVNYSGTAVAESESIEIGLISANQLEGFADQHELVEDSTSLSGRYIYWNRYGSSLSSETILDYESRLGYATNEISPTSSYSFADGDEFTLRTSPDFLKSNDTVAAGKTEYTYISFALRVGHSDVGIYLNSSSVNCDHDVKNAVRVHFLNPNDTKNSCIFNPSAENAGYTDVGGILNVNLKNDDTYDRLPGFDYEYLYGQVEDFEVLPERYDGKKEVDPKDITCFKSNHEANLYKLKYTPKKAYYSGTDMYNSKMITYTGEDGIAELNTTIYLEGWDHACIDAGISHCYSLSLQFSFGGIS